MQERILQEDEQTELKENWSERALEDIAAFANHRGGSVWVGVRDDGTPAGFDFSDAKLQAIANQIVDVLDLRPSINRRTYGGKPVLVIDVDPTPGLVSCKGRYLTRVGSTNRDMTPQQMAQLVLARSGLTWDALRSESGLDAVDPEIVRQFLRLARNRLPGPQEGDPPERVLANLDLLKDGELTNAALLLFTPRPQRRYITAQVRVGRFKSGGHIVGDRTAAGDLFAQLDGAMEALRSYIDVRYEFPGEGTGLQALQRREVWDYPLDALREAIVNALIHRDYTESTDIQIRVYDDAVDIWSPGVLPQGVTLESLRQEHHTSKPRNALLAQTFFYAELIEKWGSGTTRMIAACRAQGLPEPEFSEFMGGFRVVFSKDPYTPNRLRTIGLADRQIQAVLYVKEHGSISSAEYQQRTAVSRQTAARDLDDLVERGVLTRVGRVGRGTRYRLGELTHLPHE